MLVLSDTVNLPDFAPHFAFTFSLGNEKTLGTIQSPIVSFTNPKLISDFYSRITSFYLVLYSLDQNRICFHERNMQALNE